MNFKVYRMKAEWKYASRMFGVLSMIKTGPIKMLLLFVISSDSADMVNTNFDVVHTDIEDSYMSHKSLQEQFPLPLPIMVRQIMYLSC